MNRFRLENIMMQLTFSNIASWFLVPSASDANFMPGL